MLARIVNEQGRVQVGKGWGGAQSRRLLAVSPSRNSRRSTLRRWTSPSSTPRWSRRCPNVATHCRATAPRASPTCYYGQGRCQ
ncbi:MAG: hypothetical protein MZW92_45090 [Comamonadaceae bacterium]|nr:hypothetical protein [Comamonadaceae bacterium]